MTFADTMAADMAVFFNTDELAVSAVYNGATITVIPYYLTDLERTGESLHARALIAVQKADVPQWVTGTASRSMGAATTSCGRTRPVI